jgi:hypothetical protein
MMWSETAPYLETLRTSVLLIVIASFGGLVLFGLKMAEHFNRPLGRKLSRGRYAIFFVFLLLTLPAIGAAIVTIYVINGDKISPVLAFQIGLTSPAIVQSLIIAAVKNPSETGRTTNQR